MGREDISRLVNVIIHLRGIFRTSFPISRLICDATAIGGCGAAFLRFVPPITQRALMTYLVHSAHSSDVTDSSVRTQGCCRCAHPDVPSCWPSSCACSRSRRSLIGVYGWDEEDFAQAIRDAATGVFVDVRRRRGLRGATYAWANSTRLQATLADLGIPYVHRLDVAPSDATRHIVARDAIADGIGYRERTILSEDAPPACSESGVYSFIATSQSTLGLCAVLVPGLHRRSQATLEEFGMESARFDSLARAVVAARTRRHALTVLVGGTLGLLELTETSANKGKGGKGGGGKGGGKNKNKNKNPCDEFAGEEMCGGRCCNVLVDKCCRNTSCCDRAQGCSVSGICSDCPKSSDPCQVAVCNSEGLVRYDPRCSSDAHCCSGTCCPNNGLNKCCPGKTGCWDPNTPCPA